jgi:hypothetical protein
MKVHLAVRCCYRGSVARSLVCVVCIVLAPAYRGKTYMALLKTQRGKPLASCTFSVLASSGEQIRGGSRPTPRGRYTVFLQPGIYAGRVSGPT